MKYNSTALLTYCNENYDVSSNLKLLETREQIKKTNLIKYGVENPQQNKDITPLDI